MKHTPADVVRYLIIQLGLGGNPVPVGQAWPVYVAEEPDRPDQIITVFDTSGLTFGSDQNTGRIVEHAGIQLLARGTSQRAAYLKLDAIREGLNESVNRTSVTIITNSVVSTYQVDSATQRSTILDMGSDDSNSNRSLCSLNYTVSITQLS